MMKMATFHTNVDGAERTTLRAYSWHSLLLLPADFCSGSLPIFAPPFMHFNTSQEQCCDSSEMHGRRHVRIIGLLDFSYSFY